MNSTTTPAVAVVIPVFNRPTLVVEAVLSAVEQDYARLQVVVVDDGSTDDATSQVVAGLAADHSQVSAILLERNGGQSAARNRGAESVVAEYVTFLDSDDLLPANRIQQQVDSLLAAPEMIAVMGRIEVRVAEGIEPPPMVVTELEMGAKASSICTAMIELSVFLGIGGFAEELRYGDDVDLLYRLQTAGSITHTESVWLIRRIHEDNLVHDTEAIRKGMFQVLRRRRSEAAKSGSDRR